MRNSSEVYLFDNPSNRILYTNFLKLRGLVQKMHFCSFIYEVCNSHFGGMYGRRVFHLRTVAIFGGW